MFGFIETSTHKKGLLIILIFIILTNLAILFNIPVLRQILGLILLIILPGLLILFLLKLDKQAISEKIVLTVGLSTAFLMFFGWILNQISLQLGYTRPLEPYTLLFSLSGVLVMLAIGAYVRNQDAFSEFPFHLTLNAKGKLVLLLPMTFPLLSVLGTQYLNNSDNNVILVVLLFLIVISVILISVFKDKISEDTFPVTLILISASLLIWYMLRSEHILGHDVHAEYYLFQMTLTNSHWSIIGNWGMLGSANLDSCLSISVLPAMFQSLLHLNGDEYLFMGLYALICTFTPLVIYIISKKYIGQLSAFLAAFFVMSQSVFLSAPGNPRTNLAIFFFALCIMVLFNVNISGIRRKGLFIIFVVATVVSHYSTTYIFLLLLISTFLLGLSLRKYWRSKTITLTGIAFFTVVTFLWYHQLTQTPFASAVQFFQNIIERFSLFWAAEVRVTEISMLAGQGMTGLSPFQWITWVLLWFTFIIIGTGIIGTLIKRKEMILAPQYSASSPGFLRRKFEPEFFLLAIMSSVGLVTAVVMPFMSIDYDLGRLYFQMIVPLSVFFVIGAVILSKYLRVNSHFLILLILIPYFLLITGAVEEAFGRHVKHTLDSRAPASSYELVYEQESQVAPWLKKHMDEEFKIYTTIHGGRKLMSQGRIASNLIDILAFPSRQEIDGYVYFNYNNVVNSKLVFRGNFYDMSDYSDTVNSKNKLYSNGGSEIYK